MIFTTLVLPNDVTKHLEASFTEKKRKGFQLPFSFLKLFMSKRQIIARYLKRIQSLDITELASTPVTDFLRKKIEEIVATTDTMEANYNHIDVTEKMDSPFDWHTDNDESPFNCFTAVLYYHKSETVKGGNLYYIEDGKEIKLSITPNKYRGVAQLALFDGDVEHYVSILKGKGIRQSVSFFIEKQ